MSELKEERDYYDDRSLKSVYFVDEQGRKQGESITYKKNSMRILHSEIFKDGALQKRKSEDEHLIEIFGKEARELVNEESLVGFTIKYYEGDHLYEQKSFEKSKAGSLVTHTQEFDDDGKLVKDDRDLGYDTPLDRMRFKDGKEWDGYRGYEKHYSVRKGFYIGDVDCQLQELWDKGYLNFSNLVKTEDDSVLLSGKFHVRGTFSATDDGVKFCGTVADNYDSHYGRCCIHPSGTLVRFDGDGSVYYVSQSKVTGSYEHDIVEKEYKNGKLAKRKFAWDVYFGPDIDRWVSDKYVRLETFTPKEDGHVECLVEVGTDSYNTYLDYGIPDNCERRKIAHYTTKDGKYDGVFEEFSTWYGPKAYSEEEYKKLKEYLSIRKHYKDGCLDGVCQKFNSEGWMEVEAHYKDGKLHGEYKLLNSDGTVAMKRNYENGIYKEKSEDGRTETWFDEKDNIVFHSTDGKDDTKAYIKAKVRREMLRKVVAKKIDKRDKKNPNPEKKSYKRVIKNKTLTKMKIAWKTRKSEGK